MGAVIHARYGNESSKASFPLIRRYERILWQA